MIKGSSPNFASHIKRIQPIKYQCCPYIGTSQLIYCANQLTGFYMRATLAFNGLSELLNPLMPGGNKKVTHI